MRSKRRASSVYTDPADTPRRKRRIDKYVVLLSDNDDGDDEEDPDKDDSEALDEDEWFINCILDETESQYLIDWVGNWSPTWEPKENANEAATQAWEEKKRIRLSQKESGLREIQQIQSHTLDPSEHSLECPDSGTGPQSRSNSPLFVPLDRDADSTQLPETSETPQQIIGLYQVASSRSNNNRQTGHDFQAICKETPSLPGVFEYTPKHSIPPEYRLESDEPFVSPTPSPVSVRAAFALDPSGFNLDGAGFDIVQKSGKTKQAVTRGACREIPETPPFLVSGPDQTLRVCSRPQQTGSQGSAFSHSIPSSTLASRIYLPEDPPLRAIAGNTDSIPESVPTQNSSTSTSQQFLPTNTMEDQNEKKEVPSLAETMEKYSHLEGSTPREKLRNAYAKLREKGPSEVLQNDPSATPSSVGDIEPAAPVQVPETVAPLSVRVDKEPAHHETVVVMEPIIEPPLASTEPQEPIQTIHPSALTVTHIEHITPGSLHLGPSEFAVPLPMDSRVRDDYQRVLASRTQSISGIIDGSENLQVPQDEERVMLKVQEVLRDLSNVATHPDLNITQHIRASETDLGKEASWAEYSSAKFLLLGYLADSTCSRDLHVVITVHGEKSQKVVERYLLGKGFIYTRMREEMGSGTNVEVSMAKGPLSFGIQSTSSDGVMETYKPPSAIIALDSSLNIKSPSVEHMRTTYARNGHLLPVIWLIIANSSEHIEHCFPGPTSLRRLLLLLRHCQRLREMVGDLQDDALGVHEDADEIMASLLSENFNAQWTLPLVEPLRNMSPSEALSTELQNESSIHSPAPSNPTIQKRLFTDDGGEQASKRPRMDVSQDTSQLSELSKDASHTLDNDLQALEKNLVHMRNSHATAVEKLQKALAATQSRLQEREKILASLQHRYETRTTDFHKIRHESDRLAESKTTSDQKLEKQKQDITKLKDERTQMRHDLEQAREELKNGGGDIAALESAREEIRRLTKENASLERKAEFERKQAEYIREQYQTASSVAAQSGNEIRQLREENETLKRKVAGDATRLRELNIKNDETRHLTRVTELELILASREDLLRRKEDELREIRKNRPSTRSTSTQPRSPKWTAANSRPTSPGFNNGSNFPGRGSALRFSSEMSL